MQATGWPLALHRVLSGVSSDPRSPRIVEVAEETPSRKEPPPKPSGPMPDVPSEAPGTLQDPEVTWPHNEIRVYPASTDSLWTPKVWMKTSMVIVDTVAELLEARHAEFPRLPSSHFAIAETMFDNINKCGILLTPDGYSAQPLRDFLLPSLKVRPRLSLTVKEDFLHPVVGAVVPRTYKALPDGAMIRGLKMMNGILSEDLFELIKVAQRGKNMVHYFVTSFEVMHKIQKRAILYSTYMATFRSIRRSPT